MQDFAIAVFVKTPKLSSIKTRLAESTDRAFSDEFYHRSVKATEEVVLTVQEQFSNVCPYWAIAEEQGLTSDLWSRFEKIWQGNGDLGDRLFQVYNTLKKRHRFVILIGADSPLIHIDHFSETFKSLISGNNFILGPAYDGGFYLFGGSLDLSKSVWKKVRYSTNTTCTQLKNELKSIGSIRELEPIWDIDTKEDIHSLLDATPSSQPLLQHQTGIINWMSDYYHS